MKRFEIIKLVDLLSFISLLSLISTGTLLKFTLPPRSGNTSIWGFTRHDWGDVHFCLSVTFLLIISFHLFLHGAFIKKVFTGDASREHKYRIIIGVFSLVILIVLLFSPTMSSVDDPEKKRGGQRYEQKN